MHGAGFGGTQASLDGLCCLSFRRCLIVTEKGEADDPGREGLVFVALHVGGP